MVDYDLVIGKILKIALTVNRKKDFVGSIALFSSLLTVFISSSLHVDLA
tara:strand:+ start:105 stop:251 length:147 start_codon:yes stop_codon:yes gene_type:complete